jgi:hypothetical protein
MIEKRNEPVLESTGSCHHFARAVMIASATFFGASL